METTAIDTKAAPNQKSGIALLFKTLNKSSRPSPNVSFASILNEKTFPIPLKSGDKNVPVNNVKVIPGHKGEQTVVNTAKASNDKKPALSDPNKSFASENSKDASCSDISVAEADFSGAVVPAVSPPAIDIPVATAGTTEQTVHKTENASIIPVTDLAPAAKDKRNAESISVKYTLASNPAEKVSQIAEMSIMNPVATPATAGQADHKAENASIIPATDLTQAAKDNRATETIFVNNEASIPVVQNMMQSSDTIKPVNRQSAENVLAADLTAPGRAAYKAEAVFVNPVATPATAGQADHKTDTAQTGVGADRRSAANDSQEVKTVSINRMDAPAAAEKAGHKMEAVFMNRVADMLRQKDDSQATENTLNQVRRTVITLQDYGRQTMSPKEMAAATEMQLPVPAPAGTSDSEVSISPATPDRVESLELLHDAVTMKDAAATVTDSANGNDRNRNMIPNNQAKSMGHETLLFRMDASGSQASSETGTTSSDGSAGINTQAIIDQIIDAKQAMGNDFGRIRIVLDPPNLGTVDLSIVVRKDRVGVVMTADNESVQQVLQSHMNDIRAAFQRQDLRIETFQVLVQDNGGSQQQFNGGAMFEQHRGYQSRQAVSDDTPIIPIPSSIGGAAPAKGLVSVFV